MHTCTRAHSLSQTIRQAKRHLFDVITEGSVYKKTLGDTKAYIKAVQKAYFPIKAHYSFDMPQQVVYPNDPHQPGPMYFWPLENVFGVCCEAISHQVNYLIYEAVDMGKGSTQSQSSVFYFIHHALGEKKVHLHADNCGDQNKNATMVQYLLWRVMTGCMKRSPYHLWSQDTKFSLNWCFGLLKIQKNKSGWSHRPCLSSQWVLHRQRRTAHWYRRWDGACSYVRLAEFLCWTLHKNHRY